MALLLMLLSACQRDGRRVDARDYDAFWLWAGVKPQPVLGSAKTIYILQGEIRDEAKPRITTLRPGTPRVGHATLWLVYRIETLDWGSEIIPQLRADIARWQAAGNTVTGIQIDFDAATKGLGGYAQFLKNLRAKLPTKCQLSVTGLLDWSSHGDAQGLNQLSGVVDEVVLQTYQGRHTIPGYSAYMNGLRRIRVPFRIGLIQNGEWQVPHSLGSNPYFRGYVVFLINPGK
jgi:Protein of unknown function (DUF3142)